MGEALRQNGSIFIPFLPLSIEVLSHIRTLFTSSLRLAVYYIFSHTRILLFRYLQTFCIQRVHVTATRCF